MVAALRELAVEEACGGLLEDVYRDCRGSITLHRRIRESAIGKGVRQRDTISLKLFTACLN